MSGNQDEQKEKDLLEKGLENPTDDLVQRILSWSPRVSEGAAIKLELYLSELLRFNKRLNLISPASTAKADIVHLADSILAWEHIDCAAHNVTSFFDFGAGNGLPGIVGAILNPELAFNLVDRDERKLEFMKHAGGVCGLSNIVFSKKDVSHLPSETIHAAVSRGFASVYKTLVLARPLFQINGVFWMLKGEGWSKELADVPPQVFNYWDVEMAGKYLLPKTGIEHVIIKAVKRA